MKKQALILIITFIFAIILCGTVSAADYTVKVGEDITFTNCNYHSTSEFQAPPPPSLLDAHREVKSEDNTAIGLVSPTSDVENKYDQGGGVHSQVGVVFHYDAGNRSWDEVKNTQIEITVNLNYYLQASYAGNQHMYGTAQAFISDSDGILYKNDEDGKPDADEYLDWIGGWWDRKNDILIDLPGTKSKNNLILIYNKCSDGSPLTIDKVNQVIYDLTVFSHAFNGAHNLAQGSLTINSIKIHFLPVPVIKEFKARMVSPNELGVGVKVETPSDSDSNDPVKLKVSGTINGKSVEKTFDITDDFLFNEANIGWDANNNAAFNTPLKLNLKDLGVPRFKDNIKFKLKAVAISNDVSSDEKKTTVEILLPVAVLHGYIHPYGYPLPWWQGGNLIAYQVAYAGLYSKLVKEGYSKVKKPWLEGSYRTLWDPDDLNICNYANPWYATPTTIRNDMDKLVKEIKSKSYADKINFIGHSFGGLVARYYSSVRPENINTVITVGTPHLGVTLAYQILLSCQTRKEAENMLKIKSGSYKGQTNIMLWTAPKYNCLYDSKTGKAISVPQGFKNTMVATPNSNVKYYSIYSNDYNVEIKLYLKKSSKDPTWYTLDKTKTESEWKKDRTPNSDGYIPANSASAFGKAIRATHTSKHAYLCNSSPVQSQIINILKP